MYRAQTSHRDRALPLMLGLTGRVAGKPLLLSQYLRYSAAPLLCSLDRSVPHGRLPRNSQGRPALHSVRHHARFVASAAVQDNDTREKEFLREEEELKQTAETRLQEVLASIDAAVQSGATARGSSGAKSELYGRLSTAIEAIQEGLIERDVEARLMLLAALSGEHILFIGPPGTAKSELGRRLSRLYNGPFFERLLTRFSVPEELFGPLSMQALEDDKYVRKIQGYLPSASVAFIDEIFKANSAILNTLLTILNERLFDNGTERLPVPLVCLVGASNELPESEELDALYDRFLVRRAVGQVSLAGLDSLLMTTDTALAARSSGDPASPAADTSLVTHEDFTQIRLEAQRAVSVPENVLMLLRDLRDELQNKSEPPVYVSDRRLIKAIALMKVSAFTNGRTEVSMEDCLLLQHVMWQRPEESEKIGNFLLKQLAQGGDVSSFDWTLDGLFARAVQATGSKDAISAMLPEATGLRQAIAQKLTEVKSSVDGRMPVLTEHLWLGKGDAEAAAVSLKPKLKTSLSEVSRLLAEAVSLEVGLERSEEPVKLAAMLPIRWQNFIKGRSGKKQRQR